MRARLLAIPLLLCLCASWANAKCGIPATKRGNKARQEFMRLTGYPKGRPGYVVDHVRALCVGGADEVGNMQWQTVAEAKAKDKWECKCHVQ
jgi:hypothetical protein